MYLCSILILGTILISGGTLGKTTTLMNLETFEKCNLDIDICFGVDCPNAGHMRAGLLGKNFPIFCSGSRLDSWQNVCQVWGYETPTLEILEKRVQMMVQWDEESVWLSGGYSGSSTSKTSVIVSLDGVTPGPDLPYASAEYCIVKINDDLFAIMGGEGHYKHLRFYSKTTNSWTAGPDTLGQHRKRHTCGVFQIKGVQYLALIGGMKANYDYLDTVEYFNMETNTWKFGKYFD